MRTPITFTVIIFFAINSIADVPPPPSPAELCEGKIRGEQCSWDKEWVCQSDKGRLVCMSPDEIKNLKALIKANEHDDGLIEKVEAKADDIKMEIPKMAEPPASGPSEEVVPSPQGCMSLSAIPSGFVSLLSMLLGLSLFIRFRKK
jgi:hypothetical protein